MSIFKSGSIRGRWDIDWNTETVYRIGYHLADMFGWSRVVIGQDGRNSSETISSYLHKGLMHAGCDVTSIGMIDTPAVTYANIKYKFDGSIMITASHNPVEYNGLKISGENALVISRKNGLAELEEKVQEPVVDVKTGAQIFKKDIQDEYLEFLAGYREGIGELKYVVDCSSGMAAVLIHRILEGLPGSYMVINDVVDGNFPAHGPDPTNVENLTQLKDAVANSGADLGVCFDGDGDRAIFIDEKGRWISPDLILGVLSLYYFKYFTEKAGNRKAVLYDARCSNSVKDYIETLGGRAHICSTGHTAMQLGIPEKNAIIGGELPGHYYYADYFNLDNGWIPFLQVLAVLSRDSRKLSEIIDEINSYYFSGELNFKVPDGDTVIEQFRMKYSSGTQTFLDGIRVDYKDWWFLLRMANTEPVLRLVVEGRSRDILDEKIHEIKELIFTLGGSDL